MHRGSDEIKWRGKEGERGHFMKDMIRIVDKELKNERDEISCEGIRIFEK